MIPEVLAIHVYPCGCIYSESRHPIQSPVLPHARSTEMFREVEMDMCDAHNPLTFSERPAGLA